MAGNWYLEQELEREDRNESFGQDFIKWRLEEQDKILKSQQMAKIYTHKNGQLSLFEEVVPQHRYAGTTRGMLKITKREDKAEYGVAGYMEGYGPEVEN